jgi:hypothetical protein
MARATADERTVELSQHYTDEAGKDYAPGDKITLTTDRARAFVMAGYTTIDPEDAQAVARALKSTTKAEPSATSGQ